MCAIGVCMALLAAWYPDGVRVATIYLLWQMLSLAWAVILILRVAQAEDVSTLDTAHVFCWLAAMCWLATPPA